MLPLEDLRIAGVPETYDLAWLEALESVTTAHGVSIWELEGQLSRLTLVEELGLRARYKDMCARLSNYQTDLAARAPECVVVASFAVRPSPRTREAIGEGIASSWVAFFDHLEQLSGSIQRRNVEAGLLPRVRARCSDDDEGGAGGAAVRRAACALSEETLRVLSREVSEESARRVSIAFLRHLRAEIVQHARAQLGSILDALLRVAAACARFGKCLDAAADGPEDDDGAGRTVRTMRAWLRDEGRRGLSSAVHRLCERGWLACHFQPLEWLTGQYASMADAEVVRAHTELRTVHRVLCVVLAREAKRVRWLIEATPDHPCWNGTVLLDATAAAAAGRPLGGGAACPLRGGAPVHDNDVLKAPPHQQRFSEGKEIRMRAEDAREAHTCNLVPVRVLSAAIALLCSSRLLLHHASVDYLLRIARFEHARYDAAASRIERELLAPFARAARDACAWVPSRA